MINKEKRYTIIHYLFGSLPARLGDEMVGQGLLLLGLALTYSSITGSIVLAALTFSAALGGPFLGAVLDRSQKPGQVLAGVIGLFALGIAILAISLNNVSIWVSVVFALTVGILMPAISGGWSSRLKSFIAEEQIARASAIDATTFNIAGLAGPALAGLIAANFGVHWAVIVVIMLLISALPMAWRLPTRDRPTGAQKSRFIEDFTKGFKTIFENKKLLRITLVSATSYLGIGMLWVLYPLLGDKLFGNPGLGGLLASVVSIAALVATLTYAKWPTKYTPDRIVFATTLMLAAAMASLAFTNNIGMVLAIMALVGLADGPQLAAVFTVRHRESPDRSRSQVFTTGASWKISAAALGALLAGYVSTISINTALLAAAFVQLAAAGIYILSTLRRPQ